MRKLYLDSETCGFHGLPVLLQYAYDNGPINLYDIWKYPVHETLTLIEEFMQCCLVGFNLSFDHFHLCKLYTIWKLLPSDLIPENDIELVAKMEPIGRDGPCLKPASALDLMLHSRKGEHQSLMARKDIRIRKVPSILAAPLAHELEQRVKLDGILFAKRSDPSAPKWKVYDRTNRDGNIDPEFKDVVLKFNAAGGLKYLAEYVLEHRPDFVFTDIACDKIPVEKGYIPFALGISKPEDDWQVWDKSGKLLGQTWPALIRHHIEHWSENKEARQYAEDDVKYTRLLDEYYNHPEPGDDDSTLACMVAAVRWHGFTVDIDKVKVLLEKVKAILVTAPVNINKPVQIRAYIRECMDDTEALLIDQSTKKANLEQIRDEMVVVEPGEICIKCLGTGKYKNEICKRCGGKGELEVGPMFASQRAAEILRIKDAFKEAELYSKLIEAGRFHASFNVIGTLSSRMSGADGLNAQGIKHTKEVRQLFPLKWGDMILCGGDFDSFEVVLADAVFGDPALRYELLSRVPCHECGATGFQPCDICAKRYRKPMCPDCKDGQLGPCEECGGAGKTSKKLHAMMGEELYPGKTYMDICNSKGQDFDMYSRGKQAVFALLYGGDQNTIHLKLAVPLNVAEEAFENFQKRFPEIKRKREEVFEKFAALRQPGGLGTAVIWKDPADCSETFLGFKRFFTVENSIIKELFNLARRPPKQWSKVDLKVVRRDRIQTAGGAVSSALYGAAFQLQSSDTRAANNHLIQSPGAQITKAVQRAVWEVQPAGANEWLVAPFNVHDEVMCVMDPIVADKVAEQVQETVESYRDQVPLIAMEWVSDVNNWGNKDTGLKSIKIASNENVGNALDDMTDEGGGFIEWDGGLDGVSSDDNDILETLL